MKANIGPSDRTVRGLIGVVSLVVGLSVGRRAWWGVLLDVLGAVMLLSATTGFCHVRETLHDFAAAKMS